MALPLPSRIPIHEDMMILEYEVKEGMSEVEIRVVAIRLTPPAIVFEAKMKLPVLKYNTRLVELLARAAVNADIASLLNSTVAPLEVTEIEWR